jgi:TolB-like protein/Flp pilus assembly protein TadD
VKTDNFFAELKRRNVVRMAGLYLVGAWLIVQVAGTVFPMFGAPEWLPRSIVVLLAIGFVPALIFSWVFELTPEGLKRDEEIAPEQSIAPQTARRMDRMIIVVLLFALGYFAIDKFVLNQRREIPALATKEKSVPNERSVAVLAFANLSDDKGSEYFSDGISEELLTVLQKIPGLHVAARTSAFSFKGKNATAQEIGAKLGVARLVEGSVRKAGELVRIAARLTRADTGEQVWSENYTRDLKDVFAVQTELAQTIVGQLSGQLSNGAADLAGKATIQAQVQAAEKGGTKNAEAHQHYLQGRFEANRHSEQGHTRALVEYQKAIELDPAFALAWAALASSHVWMCDFSGALGRAGFDSHLASARDATARALALEPNLPEALRARAQIQLHFDFDLNGGSETLRTALRLAPADSTLFIDAGNVEMAKGNAAQGIALFRNAVALDPVNPAARAYLAYNLAVTRQGAEAKAEYDRVIELSPAAPWAHAGPGISLLLQGKFEEAATEGEKDAAEWARLYILAMARWSQKRIPEADAALAALIKSYADTAACQISAVYAWRGEKDQAFAWMERAREQRDPGIGSVRAEPFFDSLHGDPRWDAFLHRMGLADDQLK